MKRGSITLCGLLLAGAMGTVPALANDQLNVGMANTPNTFPSFLVAGSVSAIHYDGTTDDLLTAGQGKTGLAGAAPVVTDANTRRSAARPPSRTAMYSTSSSRVLR